LLAGIVGAGLRGDAGMRASALGVAVIDIAFCAGVDRRKCLL